MSISFKETWTVLHGLIFGTVFLLAFAGGIAGLWSLRPELVTAAGLKERMNRLVAGTIGMAATAWITVISGTWVVYVWYRDPAKTSPRSLLLANPETAEWHKLGMEWKEHVAWLAPIFATVVAYLVWYYGRRLMKEEKIRKIAMTLYVIAFMCAASAGVFGAFINKVQPTR